jgi:hypothetical protein
MSRKRVVWGVIAIVVLLLMLAPLGSYCLGREEDYRDKGELSAPRQTGQLIARAGPPV